MVLYDFIEIGTSDFDTLIQQSDDTMVGLSIEPLTYYLDRLPSKQNVKKLNIAISNYVGEIKIYSVKPEIIAKHNLPYWLKGCSSVNHYHPTAYAVVEGAGLAPLDVFSIDTVRVIDIETLIKENDVTGCKFLKIDTEGHDYIILNNYLDYCDKGHPELLPEKVQFECNILTIYENTQKLIRRFAALGYQTVHHDNQDVIMVK